MPAHPYHGGHTLADILRGWRQGGHSVPWLQEHLAALITSGDIEVTPARASTPALREGWWLEEVGQMTRRRLVIVVPAGEGYESCELHEFRCRLSDVRLLDPNALPSPTAPAVAEDKTLTDTDPDAEEQLKAAQTRAVEEWKAALEELWVQEVAAPVVAPKPEQAPQADAAQTEATSESGTDSQAKLLQPDLLPEAEPVLRRRGRPVEHPWDKAADHVDEWVKNVAPLEHDRDGVPIIQRGIDRMLIGFQNAKDPKPPDERQIRAWISNHPERTTKWWNPGD